MNPPPLSKITKNLSLTAMGEKKSDLVVKGSDLVNVYSREIIESIDVAVKKGRIALVGDADHTIGSETKVIDGSDKYLTPGFLDGHVHIDDSMATVTEFARAVIPRGTTGVFMDPHEIANVLGLKGVKLMIEESRGLPLKVYNTVPSCVPATSPSLETTGAEIGPEEVKEAMRWDETVALGEMMNYPGVIQGNEKIHEMIEETLNAGKVVEGHAPGMSGKSLNAYAAAGISSCHESTEMEEGLEKLRLGMHLMIREGFASLKNLSDLISIVTEENVDSNRISLVTDDRHPKDLTEDGHMDDVVRRAIEEGVDPVKAIQMSSLNTAKHFQVDGEIGGIAPGKSADMVTISDLSKIEIDEVIIDGEIMARAGKLTTELKPYKYPKFAENSVRIPKKLGSGDFEIKTSSQSENTEVRVIKVKEGTPKTESIVKKLPVSHGSIQPSTKDDVAKISVIERHNKTGNIGLGFVNGFGFEKGATASTIAHDSHNLLVLGTNDDDMASATNKLAEVGGGIISVSDGEILAMVKLPIAGLMSKLSLKETNKKMKKVSESWKELGCKIESPFSTMVLLALPVIPELRITDKGLIDANNFEILEVEV
ncbi:adenosine deaminase [candidate division MSBL1 archaeon SCGC-AAA382K21]|uniref:Adenine deaminase n=1 Tax=candidate division MSBL1 archaeon SCGC-AAA382K21 TaxID=1698283 RepID=A0A133VM83_9EURY|nr:adenosine deaminase [candidate division MSBL1 archaeon SCGC-AAA382K21]